MSSFRHLFVALAAALVAVLVTAPSARAQEVTTWSPETVDALGALPIQDGGRVKPLSTYAGFTLLRLSGRRKVELEDGTRLSPDAFLFDALVQPEVASTWPLFLVAEGAAIDAIGLDARTKKRRARWSFDELRPGLAQLFELAQEWSRIEPKRRSATQEQTVTLAEGVHRFLDIAGYLDFARMELPVEPDGEVARMLEDDDGFVRYSQLVAAAPAIGARYRDLANSGDPIEREVLRELDGVLSVAADRGRTSRGLALLPPGGESEDAPVWRSPEDVLTAALDGEPAAEHELAALRALEDLSRARDDGAASAALSRLADATRGAAERRGEGTTNALERSYYAAAPLTWGTAAFVMAFVLATLCWLRPKNRWVYRATVTLAWLGLAFLTAAIVVRCVIRGRPPVSTLYETVLFVTATGALVALITEAIDRRRIAVSAAAVLGTVGLFLAAGYEKLDAQDTMPELVAVLDTNFWLATHVTTITVGYAAGMLAALLGSGYVLLRLFRRRDRSPELFRALSRMVYGTICFGLLFSLVGTILGGLWANDSWGRFWGWDPKENGALLICLTMTAILHGRMGGHLKELGICVAAAFGGTVVAFSWWGVNLLGVGLHSYGFTSGVARALWSYYIVQWAICALGALVWLRARADRGGTAGA